MSRLPGEIFKVILFFQVISLNLQLKTISKFIMARSFKFSQWIQYGESILIDNLMLGGTVFHKHVFLFKIFLQEHINQSQRLTVNLDQDQD